MRRLASVLAAACVLAGSSIAGSTVASADHQAGHNRPLGAAPKRFPAGFKTPTDSEWGFPIGGFGGKLADDADYGVKHAAKPEKHYPVIFVHGNTTDHADWYPVRDALVKAGWNALDLWAPSLNGVGSQNGTDGTTNPRRDDEHLAYPGYDFGARITNNTVNQKDLYRFIREVRSYRKQTRFSLVTHSLGVTVARNVLKAYPSLRRDLVAFVGIAGGNHGTSLCPPGSEGRLMSCDEVAKGTEWLAKLNGPNGVDEAYQPARFMTIYDGTGTNDVAYLGPDYAKSPLLRGAVNCEKEDQHNDLRINPAIVNVYRKFVELAERGKTDTDCR